jgi:hypothetical protein
MCFRSGIPFKGVSCSDRVSRQGLLWTRWHIIRPRSCETRTVRRFAQAPFRFRRFEARPRLSVGRFRGASKLPGSGCWRCIPNQQNTRDTSASITKLDSADAKFNPRGCLAVRIIPVIRFRAASLRQTESANAVIVTHRVACLVRSARTTSASISGPVMTLPGKRTLEAWVARAPRVPAGRGHRS